MSASSIMLGGRLVLILLFGALLIGPVVLAADQLILLTQVLTMLCLAMLWNLVAGYGNIVVIGQHAFVGIGSYAFFGLAILLGWSAVVTIPLVFAIGLGAGVIFYILIYRLRAAYLAVGSWVVAETVMLIASRLEIFGGGSGLALPSAYLRALGTHPADRIANVYVLALALAVLIFFVTWAVMRSRIGLALGAIRDSEEGAAISGVNTTLARAATFIMVAPFVSLTGVLITLQKARISHLSSFSMVDWTIYVLFIVVIGGIGTLEGPIIGTILFFILRQFLQNFGVWYLIVLGGLAIVTILVEPRGVWGVIRRRFPADIIPLRHSPPRTAPETP